MIESPGHGMLGLGHVCREGTHRKHRTAKGLYNIITMYTYINIYYVTMIYIYIYIYIYIQYMIVYNVYYCESIHTIYIYKYTYIYIYVCVFYMSHKNLCPMGVLLHQGYCPLLKLLPLCAQGARETVVDLGPLISEI